MKIFRLFVIIIICALTLLPTSSGVAFADTRVYSDVLEDLQQDESFDINDYPINQTDFKLELLQLAEGNDYSLLVYVYQPSAGKNGMVAKKIRMSVDGGNNYYDYNLTLLSRNGVFFKYKVDNYVTDPASSVVREYKVVSLLRPADAALGDTVLDEHNNTISFIAYPVGWSFTASNHEGVLYYGKEALETVTLSDMYCGQLKFEDDHITSVIRGLLGNVDHYAMLHFIAFSLPVQIDKLTGANVRYVLNTALKTTTYPGNMVSEDTTSTSSGVISLSAEEHDTYQGGVFGHTYTWSQVMTKDDFVDNVVSNSSAFFRSDLTEGGSADLEGKQYVLCVTTTQYHLNYLTYDGGSTIMEERQYLTDETVLQISYMKDGSTYIRGVVSNYQSGDGIADNDEQYGPNAEWWENWWAELQQWLMLILLVLGLVLIGVALYFLIPFIKNVFKVVFAPFKWLFGGASGRSHTSNNKRR
ncbi:MAG: hypothetical protein IJ735_00915 [Clostridia bacterium]|nr:hypothetical protein [Clostridia bacterium]